MRRLIESWDEICLWEPASTPLSGLLTGQRKGRYILHISAEDQLTKALPD